MSQTLIHDHQKLGREVEIGGEVENLPELSQSLEVQKRVDELRLLFTFSLVEKIKKIDFCIDYNEALEKGMVVVFEIIDFLQKEGYNFNKSDIGHGLGHFLRDILHAGSIIGNMNQTENSITANEVFASMLAASLHDIGCIFVERFSDNTALNKHAEVGGYILNGLLGKTSIKIPEDIRHAIIWAVMAHTNYKPTPKNPGYLSLGKENSPISFVHITRQVDRLDTNGLLFVCRHFLSRYKTQSDFSGNSFHTQTLAEHMDLDEEKKGTMLSHLQMFLNTQEEKNGFYNKYDFQEMILKRGKYSSDLGEFLYELKNTTESELILENEIENTRKRFFAFLKTYIEPNIHDENKSHSSFDDLEIAFSQIDILTQRRWLTQFMKITEKYKDIIKGLIHTNSTTQKISQEIYPGTDKSIGFILSGGEHIIDSTKSSVGNVSESF